MNYRETCEYLFTQTPMFEKTGASAYKPGLQTTEALDAHLGHPHRSYRTIHVAGTNGKGSTSHTLAAILQNAGYKVGLFTSPHLVDFRERIRVNGEMCSEAYVVNFIEGHRSFFEPFHPSFFELTTIMALQYFAEQEVDVAVIEVGLGGRLDSTNIIKPDLSIITNISLDHTDLLGNTLAQIAEEKAGIMKTGVPCVIGDINPETLPVFEKRARELTCELILAHAEAYSEWKEANICTIKAAAEVLKRKFDLSDEHIRSGIKDMERLTGLRGRWETISDAPLTICDVGHNPGAWNYLSIKLRELAQGHKLHIVFGMCGDKDVHTVLSKLPQNATYYWAQANNHRAVPSSTLATWGQEFGLSGQAYFSVDEAYHTACQAANESDAIFIGGSCYIVADFLSL